MLCQKRVTVDVDVATLENSTRAANKETGVRCEE